MKVLHVAEKNSSAKTISTHLSNDTTRRREGKSKYNKIYEWDAPLFKQNCKMIMTSVSGHIMKYDFIGAYRKWKGYEPLSLFDAPVVKQCSQDSSENIKKTLEKEVKACGALVIWTDCDREGENIGFEIINVCQAVKPNIQVYRARFSELTRESVCRALDSLEEPDKRVSNAVDVRNELDLRICSAFTRFQTMLLQKNFPRMSKDVNVISYGSCLFPALRFVVDRFLVVDKFQPESRWTLKVTHEQNGFTVDFRLAKNSFPKKLPCKVLLETLKNQRATVVKVDGKHERKSRPVPLNTVELEKQCFKNLGLTIKETMDIAEKLYIQGFISYPRTKSNKFSQEMDWKSLVTQQSNGNASWSRFAQRVLEEDISPRQGKKSDQAHPPIHPTEFTDYSLRGDEKRVYEFVVRHFLACMSKDAEGFETFVEIKIADEKFATTGLQITAKNYLEGYIYEKWNAKEIHTYEMGQTFQPTSIEMVEEKTSPPNLLTEADLITLMDEEGIGTDSTHAGHIENLKLKKYVEVTEVKDEKYLRPTRLGRGLVMGYKSIGLEIITKPDLRARLEENLRKICDGEKEVDEVLRSTLKEHRKFLRTAIDKKDLLVKTVAEYLGEQPVTGTRAGSSHWTGNLGNTSGPSTLRRGRGLGGAAGPAPKQSKPSAGAGTSKRKCGVCGIEGHNKRTCLRSN